MISDYSAKLGQLESPVLDERTKVNNEVQAINNEITVIMRRFNIAQTDEDKTKYGNEMKAKNQEAIDKAKEFNKKVAEANAAGMGYRTELEKGIDKEFGAFNKVYKKNSKLAPWYAAVEPSVDIEKELNRAGSIEKLDVPEKLEIDMPVQLTPEQEASYEQLKTANENRNNKITELADGYATDYDMLFAELKTEKGKCKPWLPLLYRL